MNYKAEIDIARCVSKHSPEYQRAQRWLDNEVLKDCDPFVPMRTGNLRNSGIRGTVLGGGKVVYNAPYAAGCYYARNRVFRKDKHPQAQAFWFEAAKKINKKKWCDGASKIIRGEGSA